MKTAPKNGEMLSAPRQPRTNDPQRTQDDILDVATRMFAERGLNGARVDEIAEETNTSKRMIYYYFGSKEGLYAAVLQRAYLGIRRIEKELSDADMEPVEALRLIARQTFDYQARNPSFARLVAIENIHRAKFMREIDGIREHNQPIIAHLGKIIDRGVASGAFRPGINPIDLHWMISACAVFNVTNDATFSYLFDERRSPKAKRLARRTIAEEAILRYCAA